LTVVVAALRKRNDSYLVNKEKEAGKIVVT